MTSEERRSILCPNCRRLVSVDERHCPYCGLSNPGSRWKSNFLVNALRDPDRLIKIIIYVNAGMFLLSILIRPRMSSFSLNPFTFLSPDSTSLILLGATGTLPIDRFHRWWTLITANYLHGGILHILFNMVALWQIAPLIIQEYGSYRMFAIYTIGGIVGYLVSYAAGIQFTIGASAAVCALIGAAIYYGKSRGGYYGEVVYKQIGGWAIAIFAFGFLFPGINNWGHGGGIVAGILLGFLLGYEEKRPENFFHKVLATLCVVSTLVALALGIASGLMYGFPG